MLLFSHLERRVKLAGNDPAEADRLLTEYRPFIAKTVRDHTGQYVEQETSEEFAIALSAFHEAILAYDPDKGRFLAFAGRIIRLRLIDLYRSRRKTRLEDSLEALQGQDGQDPVAPEAIRVYRTENESEIRRYEILELTEELAQWGISFSQLADHSPKQTALRKLYTETAHCIAANESVRQQLLTTRRLPIKEIQLLCGIDRKRLDRGRIYLIACVLILCGDYDYLKEYLEWK